VPEMKAYFAIVIVLGVQRQNSHRTFWEQQFSLKLGNLGTHAPRDCNTRQSQRAVKKRLYTSLQSHNAREFNAVFTSAMSRRRLFLFENIQRYPHISDPDIVLPDEEWYNKIELPNSRIRERCQALAIPASDVSVDEMMVRFFGRSKHTVRMPSKPIKRVTRSSQSANPGTHTTGYSPPGNAVLQNFHPFQALHRHRMLSDNLRCWPGPGRGSWILRRAEVESV
jgi:hypothetical protein